MGVLAEYLRTEAEQLKAEKGRRRAVLREWLDSLNELHGQLLEWLKACDPENLIDRHVEQAPGPELAFGEYQVPVLKLSLVDRIVQFKPVARYMASTVRPPGVDKPVRVQGAVELRGIGGRGCYLFRLDGKWYIQREFENLNTAGNDVVPLTAERFEAVVRESF